MFGVLDANRQSIIRTLSGPFQCFLLVKMQDEILALHIAPFLHGLFHVVRMVTDRSFL